jgi:NAD-dependent SIR2 family protein deacetylase
MKDDPRWIIGKFGNCKKCGRKLKGERVAYWPRTKMVLCEACGENDMNKCLSLIQDEDFFINKR